MNNKRGFTLIELLAVIVILAMVMVLSISAISNSTGDAKEKIYETKKSNIEDAAVMYGQDNFGNLPKTISVEELVTLKYLNYDEDEKVVDPRGTYKSLNDCQVRVIKNNRKVIATFDETTCK